MNQTIIILILGIISYFFMGYLFEFLYKDSGLKYLTDLSLAWYCCSYMFFIYALNEIMPSNKKYLIITVSLTYISIFLLFKAIYFFIKVKFPNTFKHILILYVINIIVLFIIGMLLFQNDVFSSFYFSGAISTGILFVFCNLKQNTIKKHLIWNLYISIGLLFEGISLVKQSHSTLDLWTFISIISVVIIGIGFIMWYYDKVKIELEINDERYRLSIEAFDSEIWEYDVKTKSIRRPKSMGFKYSSISIDFKTIEQDWQIKVHPNDLNKLKNAFKEYLEGNFGLYYIEYRIKCEDEGYRWILSKGKALRDENGKVVKVFGANIDISDIKKAQEKLRILAYYDYLTGLLNKTAFMSELKDELHTAAIADKKCAVFWIDFDEFKLVNDILGHTYGDKFLKLISEELKGLVKDGDLLSRFGGDDFNILQININDVNDVKELVDLILHKLTKSWIVESYEFYFTVNIGISVYPDDAQDAEDLLKKANIAMHKSKIDGKIQYEFFKNYMFEEIEYKNKIQRRLRNAVEDNSFKVYYQPQLNIKTGKISGMEALVRFPNPGQGTIPPNEFIPFAEETGLISLIGEYVLKTACIKTKQWNFSRNSKLSISVNVSVIQLNQINFVDVVKKILEITDLEPQYLTLEITESVLIKSLKSNIIKLEQLKALGIKIALDDFGTGYSSLSYIVDLPIDILKIDKSFIDHITINSKKRLLIESIISVTQKINIEVVAEGVEEKEQYDFLIIKNCDKIQGYYFSKPLSVEDFEKFIMKEYVSTD